MLALRGTGPPPVRPEAGERSPHPGSGRFLCRGTFALALLLLPLPLVLSFTSLLSLSKSFGLSGPPFTHL